tara:strand:+ start:313 stop:588 length:276 start_codon:yes stop_codon:yes gene_type:complete
VISLTEEQLENILKAAKHGQARRLEMLQVIEKLLNDIDADMTADLDNGYYDLVEVDDDVFDISDLRHFQAEHGRTERIIQEIERKVIFTLD